MFKVAWLLVLGSFAAHAARQDSSRLLQDDITIMAVKGGVQPVVWICALATVLCMLLNA